jgi:flavin reductase (DIM6/NTAB) family NADH-FMN oxidoreductase RutF
MQGFTGTITSSATLTVTAGSTSSEPLVSLAVIPGSQTMLVANETAQFIAIGTTSSGSTVNLTAQSATIGNATIAPALWTSSITAVATVNSSTGLATALTTGTTTITATAKNPDGTVVTGTGALTVNIPATSNGEPLVSLAIVPGSQTLTDINQTAGFIAIGTTSAGTTVNLTNQSATIGNSLIQPAHWNSSAPAIASINSFTGLATALTNGVTAITATASNPDGTVVTAIATLTVNASAAGSGEPLVSLTIVPGNQTLTGYTQIANFIAIGTTSLGTTVNLTNKSATVGSVVINPVSWTSSVPSVASINSATGVASALTNGAAAIVASASNPDGTVVTATASITVNISTTSEPLVSLAIVPASQTTSVVGQTAQLIAIGTTATGSTINLTNQSAKFDGVTIPAATWASSSAAVASVNPNTGVATSVSSGVVAITAVASNPDGTVVTGVATLTVSAKPEPLVSLAIIPAAQTLTAAGQSAQFIVIGTTTSGATVNLTNTSATIGTAIIPAATWSSSSMSVATVDIHTGVATAGASGVTVIAANAYNPDGTVVTGTATLTVNISATPEPLVSLAITPAAQQALALNQTAQFIAIATTSAGTTVNLTNQGATVGLAKIAAAAWTSSNPAVATVNPTTGVATALSAGTAAITAIATNPDGTVVTGTAAFTVSVASTPEPLVSMAITPATQTLSLLNQTAQFTAIATTGSGTTVNLTDQSATVGAAKIAPAVWSSSNPGVATVNPGTGVAIALNAGATAITAIATNPDGTVVTGTSILTVTATGGAGGTIASINVIPGSQAVAIPNDTAQFIAIGTTTTGATVNLTNQVAWSSSSAQIANIGAGTGLATGVSAGTATITALYTPVGGNVVTGTASFTVSSGTSEQFTALAITPATLTISASSGQAQLVALATLGTNGYQQDVTRSSQITWNSSATSVAIVSSQGLLTGNAVGSTTVTAELTNPDGTVVSATADVTVVLTAAPSPLLSLAIIPAALAVGNLQGTGQFLAIGTFSTAPYTKDLTDAPTMQWISSFPNSFPVDTNSGGSSSASAGIVTAFGTGQATIIAEYTNPDPNNPSKPSPTDPGIQTATATFSCPLVLPDPPLTAGSCYPGSQTNDLLSSVTVYNEGLNTTNWLVEAPSATGTPDVVHCGPGWLQPGGSVCTSTYPVLNNPAAYACLLQASPCACDPAKQSAGACVILKASGGAFGGWSYNCVPSDANGNPQPAGTWTAAGPNYCYVPMIVPAVSQYGVTYTSDTNQTVGAIFN